MTATDELRRMLDERGVEWSAPNSIMAELNRDLALRMTYWGDTFQFCAIENYGGGLSLSDLTPQQAIEATLGRGTCKDVGRYCFSCSECGWVANEPHHVLGGFWPNYCPNCGRKVVEA